MNLFMEQELVSWNSLQVEGDDVKQFLAPFSSLSSGDLVENMLESPSSLSLTQSRAQLEMSHCSFVALNLP